MITPVTLHAVAAARTQLIALSGQDLTAAIISEVASNIPAVDGRVKALNVQIAGTFKQHPQAAAIIWMPGVGLIPEGVAAGWRPRSGDISHRSPPRRSRRAGPRT